jgi:shikimate dehydrogenase
VDSALVLGGGATAASVLLALADLGCRTATLAVRDPDRAEETLAAVRRHPEPPEVSVCLLGEARTSPVDVLVSTVPVSAQGEWAMEAARGAGVVFDVVYHPWPTPLARTAGEAGVALVGGLDLLVHQAALQVTLMTGADEAPLEAMRRAGEEALAARDVP